MNKAEFEYQKCIELEQSLNNSRWRNFVTLISMSFLITGFSFGFQSNELYFKLGISFGFLIFLTAVYYYYWFHNISHRLREHLLKLEEELGLSIYHIRMQRPKLLGIKIYFHWAINLWILAYILIFVYFVIIT